MAKQTKKDRLRRLEFGECPVHGMPMYAINPFSKKRDKKGSFFIMECCRKDCSIQAILHEVDIIQAKKVFCDDKEINIHKRPCLSLTPDYQYILEEQNSD